MTNEMQKMRQEGEQNTIQSILSACKILMENPGFSIAEGDEYRVRMLRDADRALWQLIDFIQAEDS